MIKKVFGGLLLAETLLILIGAISNGSFTRDYGSAAATYGAFIGLITPMILNVFAGIFLLRFDRATVQPFSQGFQTRKSQCSRILLFVILYGLMFLITVFGLVLSRVELDSYLLSLLLKGLPYAFPMMLFSIMIDIYALPFWSCRRHILPNPEAAGELFAPNDTFYAYSPDNFVLANSKTLFFPKQLCVIPFHQIASMKHSGSVEPKLTVTLANGKKLYLIAKKDKYDAVMAAINANRHSFP